MDLHAAETLARQLMKEHELPAVWAFEFDNAKRRMGRCNYQTRTISISRHYALAADEAHVRDTVLHEIAHAFTPRAGHGLRWKVMAQKLGATPKACAENPFATSEGEVNKLLAAVAGQPFYRVTCAGYEDKRYRILRDNQKSYSLVDEEGNELRAAKVFVYPEGQKPPTMAEAMDAERKRNLAAVAGKPVMVVTHSAYKNDRFAILRRATGRNKHQLVNLATGNILRVPPSMVRQEDPMKALGRMLAS